MPSQPNEISESECAFMRLQRLADVKYHNITENMEYALKDVIIHVRGKCSCNDDLAPVDDDSPWREPQVVQNLFIDENMHFTEIADLLDCHPETARNWVLRYDISQVPSTNRTSSKTVRLLQRIGAEQEEERKSNGGDEFTNQFPESSETY